MEPSARRSRLLYVSSTILFILYCLIGGFGPKIEPRASGEFSVTGLISQLAAIFAWTLMCAAYQMRGKPSPERTAS